MTTFFRPRVVPSLFNSKTAECPPIPTKRDLCSVNINRMSAAYRRPVPLAGSDGKHEPGPLIGLWAGLRWYR
jgi:hypothetical protein